MTNSTNGTTHYNAIRDALDALGGLTLGDMSQEVADAVGILLQAQAKRPTQTLTMVAVDDDHDVTAERDRLAESLAAMHDRALAAEKEAEANLIAYRSAMEARNDLFEEVSAFRRDASKAFEAAMGTLNDDGSHMDAAGYLRGAYDALVTGEMDDAAVVAGHRTSCDRAYERGFKAGKEEASK